MIFEPILVLVGFFASNDGTAEGLGFFVGKHVGGCVRKTSSDLSFADRSGNIAIRTILPAAETRVRAVAVCLLSGPMVLLEQSLGGFIDTKIDHVIIHAVAEVVAKCIIAKKRILH